MIIIPPCLSCKNIEKNNKEKGIRCPLLYPEGVPGEILLAKADCPSYEKDDGTEREGDMM